jgi:hypothetical protein
MVKEREEIAAACSTSWREEKNFSRFLVGTPEERKLLKCKVPSIK